MFSTWVHGMDLCGFLHGNFTTGTQPLSCGRYTNFNPLVLHLYIQAVYNNMSGSAFRRNNMARLHVFPGEEVEMLFNLINKYALQITQLRYIFLFNLSFHAGNRFFTSGSRRDHEKCDFPNTSSEAYSKEAVRLYR